MVSFIQKNGKRIKLVSVSNISAMAKCLKDFSEKEQFHIELKPLRKNSKRNFRHDQNYWKKFYERFTGYMYNKGHVDNYVGTNIKALRTFFNYLNGDLGLNVGDFHKKFYVHLEEIQIVVLSPERLNFLISNKEFEDSLSEKLKIIKDIFVFGCTVALRVSDLLNLTRNNLEVINERTYLCVRSKKTNTFTRIKLPEYATDILTRYKSYNKLMPWKIDKSYLNEYFREIAELAGWTETFVRVRNQRGIPIEIFKDKARKVHYRFCDHVTSHTMRRTAITNMLSLGMNEQLVRKISGHAASSKEFYRYVSYAQSYFDQETDMMFEKLNKKTLSFAHFKHKLS